MAEYTDLKGDAETLNAELANVGTAHRAGLDPASRRSMKEDRVAAKVTISDLAARLGIAKASVSYALNDQPGMSAATRQRVTALADELG